MNVSVVVPYTRLEPEVQAALGRVPAVRFVWVGDDDRQYWWLLRNLWEKGGPFTIVEHDVVAPEGSIASMWRCGADWCAVPYPCGAIVTTALGLTKFEDRLMRRHPDLVAGLPDATRTWVNVGDALVGELHRRGEREHVHYPVAGHLHRDVNEGGG